MPDNIVQGSVDVFSRSEAALPIHPAGTNVPQHQLAGRLGNTFTRRELVASRTIKPLMAKTKVMAAFERWTPDFAKQGSAEFVTIEVESSAPIDDGVVMNPHDRQSQSIVAGHNFHFNSSFKHSIITGAFNQMDGIDKHIKRIVRSFSHKLDLTGYMALNRAFHNQFNMPQQGIDLNGNLSDQGHIMINNWMKMQNEFPNRQIDDAPRLLIMRPDDYLPISLDKKRLFAENQVNEAISRVPMMNGKLSSLNIIEANNIPSAEDVTPTGTIRSMNMKLLATAEGGATAAQLGLSGRVGQELFVKIHSDHAASFTLKAGMSFRIQGVEAIDEISYESLNRHAYFVLREDVVVPALPSSVADNHASRIVELKINPTLNPGGGAITRKGVRYDLNQHVTYRQQKADGSGDADPLADTRDGYVGQYLLAQGEDSIGNGPANSGRGDGDPTGGRNTALDLYQNVVGTPAAGAEIWFVDNDTRANDITFIAFADRNTTTHYTSQIAATAKMRAEYCFAFEFGAGVMWFVPLMVPGNKNVYARTISSNGIHILMTCAFLQGNLSEIYRFDIRGAFHILDPKRGFKIPTRYFAMAA